MRQQGQYADLGGNPYGASQMQHIPGQRLEHGSANSQGRPEAVEGRRRWETDGSKVSDPRSSLMFNEGQGGNASRSLYPGPRPDSKPTLEKEGNDNRRSLSHEEDMDIGYDNPPVTQTYEGLEQKLRNDVLKLAKEQIDAEDAENARHIEKIKDVNSHYQEQLEALRTRHANRRDDLLQRDSLARQSQYQQAMMDSYPSGGMGPNDHHGFAAGALDEPRRAYNSDYRERARFLGGPRDQGYEPPTGPPYPGGRVYDTGARYY